MPSLCHSIKQEYEALKTLTQAFVSACEKAGDPRALSADQLRTLQIMKRKLEQTRDAFDERIETKEAKMWRKTWDDVNETVVDHGPYRGLDVQSIVMRREFIRNLVGDITSIALNDCLGTWSAIQEFTSVRGDILSETDREQIQELLAQQEIKNRIRQFILSQVSVKGIDGVVVLYSAMRCNRAFGCELLKDGSDFLRDDFVNNIQQVIHEERFQQSIANQIIATIMQARINLSPSWKVVVELQAIFGLGMVSEENRIKIQKEIDTKDFHDNVVQEMMRKSADGQASERDARDAVKCLAAMKELMVLTSRRGKK